MPIVKIDMGETTTEIKKEIIKKVTDLLSEITKTPQKAFTIVISEKNADNFGVGGIQVSEMLNNNMK